MSANIDRRHFLKLTGAIGVSSSLTPGLLRSVLGAAEPVHTPASLVDRLDLGGEWRVNQVGKSKAIRATVPGCIHTDLLAAGVIPDPFYRDNAKQLRWVDEADWHYTRQFDVDDQLLSHQAVQLVCFGVDTVATIHINGKQIATPNNMFRTWRIDIKDALTTGQNTIEFTFHSLTPYMKARQDNSEYKAPGGRSWVRKAAYMFGWDWAPNLRSCGIWRGIEIQGFSHGRVVDIAIEQQHGHKNSVTLNVTAQIDLLDNTPKQTRITVAGHGEPRTKVVLLGSHGKQASATITIDDAQLWWPNGVGEQPLYHTTVELLDEHGNVLDTKTQRIGLRTIELLKQTDQQPLRLQVNGLTIFAKGADYVPPDSFPSRVTTDKLRRLAEQAAASNMNILRFWGGGYYEDDALFDACDELGLMVWLDFKFADATYPTYDKSFMENVRQEVIDNVKRLRHHPCIAVWCGNNEVLYFVRRNMTQWKLHNESFPLPAYDKLFKQMIPGELHKLLPDAAYASGSFGAGDHHDWQVWHGDAPFDEYLGRHGFFTEYGYQAFPDVKTIHSFTHQSDRQSVLSDVMNFHQRNGGGNEKIAVGIKRYLGEPKSFDDTIYLSQIVQAYGIQIGIEHWRRDFPHSTASIYWQLNDCWPSISWASLDYYNRPKALQYAAGRSYRPLLVSAKTDAKRGEADIYVCNDTRENQSLVLTCHITDCAGTTLGRLTKNVVVNALTSSPVHKLNLSSELRFHGVNNVLLWLRIERAGRTLSSNLAMFTIPGYLKLDTVPIKTTIRPQHKGFDVTLVADAPVLWAMLRLPNADARYQDNYIHLEPGRANTIHVRPEKSMTTAEFRNQLQVHHYADMRTPIALAAQQPDGSLSLTVDNALLHNDFTVETIGGQKDITDWQRPYYWVSWDTHITQLMRFQVTAYVANPNTPVKLRLTYAGKHLSATVPHTQSSSDFQAVTFGTIDMRQTGYSLLSLHAGQHKGWHSVSVRRIELTPVK